MKEEKWIRLDSSKLKNVGGHFAEIQYIYGLDGKKWPRLVISIYNKSEFNNNQPSFHLSCNEKDKGEWWDEKDIPLSLGNDVIKIVQEYLGKHKGENNAKIDD